MRVVLKNFLRNASAVAAMCLMAGTFVGCGDASDPEAVTIDELKAPGGLWIQDNGDGNVALYWSGANYEDDFDGYNVYGMKDDGTLLGDYKEGQAVKFLDDDGNEVAAAKEFLAKFNYDPNGDKLEKAATVVEDGEKKFSALPIHEEADVLPTCGNKAGVCTPHNSTFAPVTVGDSSARGVAGEIMYSVAGLKPGSTYCFFALASISNGTKVSASSTNIQCVTPKYKIALALEIPTDANDGNMYDLAALPAACLASGAPCAAPTATADQANANGESDSGLYIEKYSEGGMTAGKYVGIQDLGYYVGGFTDSTLPRTAPAYTIGDKFGTAGTPQWSTPLNGTGGYVPYGDTIGLVKDHVYVIAVPDSADTATPPTKFFYHWMHVIDGGEAGSTTNVELRVGAKVDAR